MQPARPRRDNPRHVNVAVNRGALRLPWLDGPMDATQWLERIASELADLGQQEFVIVGEPEDSAPEPTGLLARLRSKASRSSPPSRWGQVLCVDEVLYAEFVGTQHIGGTCSPRASHSRSRPVSTFRPSATSRSRRFQTRTKVKCPCQAATVGFRSFSPSTSLRESTASASSSLASSAPQSASSPASHSLNAATSLPSSSLPASVSA